MIPFNNFGGNDFRIVTCHNLKNQTLCLVDMRINYSEYHYEQTMFNNLN